MHGTEAVILAGGSLGLLKGFTRARRPYFTTDTNVNAQRLRIFRGFGNGVLVSIRPTGNRPLTGDFQSFPAGPS